MELLQRISEELQRGDDQAVGQSTRDAVAQGIDARSILDEGLIAGMAVVGEKFRRYEIFLPDVLLAARAMYAGMNVVKPLMAGGEVPTIGKAVIGTVQGDLHDIGKNLVGIMLKGAGFAVIDLGNDVAPETFVETAKAKGAPVIGMSALLTTTMPVMKKVVDLIREQGLAGEIRTIVGGAPLSDEFARKIGADAYAFDGVSAVDRMKRLIGG
ncbi:MAG: corrinoid protein [Planctomycetota bacterium]